jgi:hypothetical protein
VAVAITATLLQLTGCRGTCSIITRHDVEPQWVCPGADFSPRNHFRIENKNEDGAASSQGTTLWQFWDTSKGKHGQPGSVSLTSQLPPMVVTPDGIIATPSPGVHTVSGSLASGYRFTLIAANTECKDDGEKWLRQNQSSIEAATGVELDDNELMTSHVAVELVSGRVTKRICVPHSRDLNFPWTGDEVRAGSALAIDELRNPNAFSVEVFHELAPPVGTVSSTVAAGASTATFNGSTPNGKWRVKATDPAAYAAFLQHAPKYIGKPAICFDVVLSCK